MTIDWVSLTAGVLLLGIIVILSIYSNGVSPLARSVNDTLSNASARLCGELESGLGLSPGDCTNVVGSN